MKKEKILSSAIRNKLTVCWYTCSQFGVLLVASSILVTLISSNKSIAANDFSWEHESKEVNSTTLEEELDNAVSLDTGNINNEDSQKILKQKLKNARLDKGTRIRRAIERNQLNTSEIAQKRYLAIGNTVTQDILVPTEKNQNYRFPINNRGSLEARRNLINSLKKSKQQQLLAMERELSLTSSDALRLDASDKEDEKLLESTSVINSQIDLLNPKNDKKVIGQNSSQPEDEENTVANINQLRQELLIEPIVAFTNASGILPGSTAGTPSAFGASWGQAFIGAGLSIPIDSPRDRVDGSFSAGFGLGDARRSVGLEISANVTSVDPEDFADSGSLGLKLHRTLDNETAIAVGWSNAIKWGDVNRAKDTFYGVVTRLFSLQPNNQNNTLPLTVSVGVGSGAFRSKGAIERNENGANIFGSLGLRVLPEVSFVSSWTGNRLNMGVSLTPIQKTPLVVNAIFTDVTSNLQTGVGFTLSAGYSFRF